MLVNTKLRVILKCLSSAAISLKYARKQACMSVCVCLDVCVLFCRYTYLGYGLKKDYIMFGKLFFLGEFILQTEKYLTVFTGYYRLYNISLYIYSNVLLKNLRF